MQEENDNDYITPEGYKLRFYDEETAEVSLKIPSETMKVMEKVAKSRSLSVESLLRMFIGRGLRIELAEKFPELQRELFERRFRNRKQNQDTEIDVAA